MRGAHVTPPVGDSQLDIQPRKRRNTRKDDGRQRGPRIERGRNTDCRVPSAIIGAIRGQYGSVTSLAPRASIRRPASLALRASIARSLPLLQKPPGSGYSWLCTRCVQGPFKVRSRSTQGPSGPGKRWKTRKSGHEPIGKKLFGPGSPDVHQRRWSESELAGLENLDGCSAWAGWHAAALRSNRAFPC